MFNAAGYGSFSGGGAIMKLTRVMAVLMVIAGSATCAARAVGRIWISVEATTGIQINPLMIEDHKADAGLSAGDTSLESWNGADWTKGRQIRAQRVLAALGPWVMQIYTTRKAGITT